LLRVILPRHMAVCTKLLWNWSIRNRNHWASFIRVGEGAWSLPNCRLLSVRIALSLRAGTGLCSLETGSEFSCYALSDPFS